MTNSELADLLDGLVNQVCHVYAMSATNFKDSKIGFIYPCQADAQSLVDARREAQRLREAEKEGE